MFEFIKFLQKRPSDKTIITLRIIFGVVLVSALYYNFFIQENPNQIENTMLFGNVETSSFKEILKYIIVALGIFPIVYGILNLFKVCVAKKKIIKISQIILGILLWYSAALIVDSPTFDIDDALVLLGILPFFAGITGKCIVSTCLKYGEKINKIRV